VISPRPDHAIITAVLQGDTDQYNELVVRHKDYAFSIALKIVNNSMDAEEIAHDAFVKAFKSLKKFNQKAKFTTWLYRIVFNTAVSHTRKNQLAVDDIDEISAQPASSLSSSDPVMSREREHFIGEAMKKLLPLDATLLTLFYLKQLNLEEIGEVVGVKADAVKVKLFRARKRLGKELELMLAGEVQEII
jgi:RNA polymerase sigma-70 factor (ECF subfamily)